MVAKIGILGESTVTTAGTTTVYTVPADKAARVQVLWEMESDDVVHYSIMIGTPASQITMHRNFNTGDDLVSGVYFEATPDPADALVVSATGSQSGGGIIDIDDPASAKNWSAVPYPADFFLSTGDTVRFNLNGGAANDHFIQVHGVEDDA